MLRNERLDMNLQCVLKVRFNKANYILDCTRKNVAGGVKEVIPHLCVALVRPRLEYWDKLWSSQCRKDIDLFVFLQTYNLFFTTCIV